MKLTTPLLATAASLLGQAGFAEGALNLYNFGLYTPPELLEKFGETYDVDVTLTDFASME